MTDIRYRRLMLDTLHAAAYVKGSEDITDQSLRKALTVNENLHSLGYTLRPCDIGNLAASPSLDGFYESVRELVPEVRANPMYPDFPAQVMKMPAAQFRMHQMMHYFSTYGMAFLTGEQVSRGWLPEPEAAPKTKRDQRLLKDTVLELVEEADCCAFCLKRILDRRERMTIPERDLVLLSLPEAGEEVLLSLKVRFKENLEVLFPEVVGKMAPQDAVRVLGHLCQHAGDALRSIGLLLKQRRYHLRTSEKRMLVKLLESFGENNSRENLILSARVRERNLKVLRYLDNFFLEAAAA